jgi:hypothetical protein
MKRFLFLEKYSQCCQREEGLLNTNKRSLKLAAKEKKSEGTSEEREEDLEILWKWQ